MSQPVDQTRDLLKILLTPDGRSFRPKNTALEELVTKFSKEEILVALQKAREERNRQGRF